MRARAPRVEQVVPAAARTISSLRDIGYELAQAVADIVDNSISARSTTIHVDVHFDGEDSWIRISDDGHGMDAAALTESLRYGSERSYDGDDLGKFGFGLKTASTSQCRRVIVASRRAKERARLEVRCLDLAHIERTNRWEILVLDAADRPEHLVKPLRKTTGTVVLWTDLDRVLDYKDPFGGWARRRLLSLTDEIARHLGMVFHRFLAGEVRGRKIEIAVNGAPVEPWDPFCRAEPGTTALPEHDLRVAGDAGVGIVHVTPYVLPDKAEFSDGTAWQRASGQLKWNRQQGFYVYRANRLIQWGGWSRLRTIDEHTKLARIAIDFAPDLDTAFGINISKAIVKLPPDLREDLEPIATQVASIAQQRYRKSNTGRPTRPPVKGRSPSSGATPTGGDSRPNRHSSSEGSGAETVDSGRPGDGPSRYRDALSEAARRAGELSALERIVDCLGRVDAEVAHDLGF